MHWVSISQRITSGAHLFFRTLTEVIEKKDFIATRFSKCLVTLHLRVFFKTGLLEDFNVHYEYKRKGTEYIACSALI